MGFSFERLAASLMMPRLDPAAPAGSAEAAKARRLARAGVFGFIVWYGDARQTQRRVAGLRRIAPYLVFAADYERGAGALHGGATHLPCALALGAAGDPGLTRATAECAGREARDIGVDLLFAPVADVLTQPRSAVLHNRCFGGDPAAVSEHVAAFVRGVRAGGAGAVVKHFPGHGGVRADSHHARPVDRARPSTLAMRARPFRAAIAAGAAGMMTAHVAFPALDRSGSPATFSTPILTGLLRRRMGFRGLVVTDGLEMAGARLGRSLEETLAGPLLAGADLLLLPPDPFTAIETLARRLERDSALLDRARDAAARLARFAGRAARRRAARPPARPFRPAVSAETRDRWYTRTLYQPVGKVQWSTPRAKAVAGSIGAHGAPYGLGLLLVDNHYALAGFAAADLDRVFSGGPLKGPRVVWCAARTPSRAEMGRALALFARVALRVVIVVGERVALREKPMTEALRRLVRRFPDLLLALAAPPVVRRDLPRAARVLHGYSADLWARRPFHHAIRRLLTPAPPS